MLNLTNPEAKIHNPLNLDLSKTHILLAFCHPDDSEFGAFRKIAEHIVQDTKLLAVTLNDGSSGTRGVTYEGMSSEEYVRLRRAEGERAGDLGHYPVINLGYTSQEINYGRIDRCSK